MAAKRPSPSTQSSTQQTTLAVLIDADNAPAAIVEGLFEEIARYGVASVKRIYGDWTQSNLGGWKKVLLDHSIQPMQQFAYTKGKNATDSSLIIDAMDLLYTGRFDGFCLVSSDSDFTRLAVRLREEGLTVYGFGEHKTPKPFVSACDKFIYTEILRNDAHREPKAAAVVEAAPVETADDVAPGTSAPAAGKRPAKAPAPPAPPAPPQRPEVPLEFIAKIIDDIGDDDGWTGLGAVGQNITKLRPDFDARLYGFKKLSDLIKAHPKHFEVDEFVNEGGAGGRHIDVRNLEPVAPPAPEKTQKRVFR